MLSPRIGLAVWGFFVALFCTSTADAGYYVPAASGYPYPFYHPPQNTYDNWRCAAPLNGGTSVAMNIGTCDTNTGWIVPVPIKNTGAAHSVYPWVTYTAYTFTPQCFYFFTFNKFGDQLNYVVNCPLTTGEYYLGAIEVPAVGGLAYFFSRYFIEGAWNSIWIDGNI